MEHLVGRVPDVVDIARNIVPIGDLTEDSLLRALKLFLLKLLLRGA